MDRRPRREYDFRDWVAERRPAPSPITTMKLGPRQRRQRARVRKPGYTVTISFAGTAECDALIDKWASARAVSRSVIVRQALRIADAEWEAQCAGGRRKKS